MTDRISIDDLRGILVACAGGGDAEALQGDISDTSFEDLGYDSLALIETSATLERRYGVVLPDDRIVELRTPRELLGEVNNLLVRKAYA